MRSDLHISVCVCVYVGLTVLRRTHKHTQHACKPSVERERYVSSELSSESSQLTVEATVGVLHMLRVRPARESESCTWTFTCLNPTGEG